MVQKPKLSGALGEPHSWHSALILRAVRGSETSLLARGSQVTPLLERAQAAGSKVLRWGGMCRLGKGVWGVMEEEETWTLVFLLLVSSKCYFFLVLSLWEILTSWVALREPREGRSPTGLSFN